MEQQLIFEIIEICIIPLLGILVKYAVSYLNAKTQNTLMNKYTTLLAETTHKCVVATNQTYVNALKEAGKFDEEAQKIAFEKTYNAIMIILNEDTKKYLEALYGDLNEYLIQYIEYEVNWNRVM